MVRKLPPEVREKILDLLAQGCTYREIHEITGASHGLIRKTKIESGEPPDQTLMRKLRRAGLDNPQVIHEPDPAETTRRLELSPSDLVQMLIFYKRIRAEPPKVAADCLELMDLQNETGMSYRDLSQDYQTKLQTRAEHERRAQALAAQIKQHESYLRDLAKLKVTQDHIEALHLTLDLLNAFVNSHLQLEQLGFTVQTATQIAQELRNLRLDPTIAVRELARLLFEHHSMTALIQKEKTALQSTENNQRLLAEGNRRLESIRADLQTKVEELTRNRDTLQKEVNSKKGEVADLNKALELVGEIEKRLNEIEAEIED